MKSNWDEKPWKGWLLFGVLSVLLLFQVFHKWRRGSLGSRLQQEHMKAILEEAMSRNER